MNNVDLNNLLVAVIDLEWNPTAEDFSPTESKASSFPPCSLDWICQEM
ncbi:MAG: hypothetical protein FWG63_08165 [Defluviitaleaceae bacterium]|nr:hypothetical protein [Defluviitaleaceae bacterium]